MVKYLEINNFAKMKYFNISIILICLLQTWTVITTLTFTEIILIHLLLFTIDLSITFNKNIQRIALDTNAGKPSSKPQLKLRIYKS